MNETGMESYEFCRPVNKDFNPETGNILVSVDKVDYEYDDRAVEYQGRVFTPKSELHITIVSMEDAEELRRFLEKTPDGTQSVWDILDETDFSFRKLDQFYHVVESPGVETIIQMVEIPMLETFFRSMSGLVGRGFLLPPTHITLYMRGTSIGIALPDQEVFRERAKAQILPGELQFQDGDYRTDLDTGANQS